MFTSAFYLKKHKQVYHHGQISQLDGEGEAESDTSGKVSNLELSFSSRKLRSDQKKFVLLSKPENEDNKS